MSDQLTDLPGVGKKTAENLRRAGFDNYEKISKASIRRLSRVSGIGETGAQKIIEAAGGETIATQTKSKEERMREAYGPVLDQIEATPASEIESDIQGFGSSEFTTGTETKPDNTVFVPTSTETAQSPFRVSVGGPRKRSLKKIHENRPEREQTVDEQQNAPITTDEEKWIENKNRLDYPGVDTIPKRRQQARAETAAKVAQDVGAVDQVQYQGQGKNLRGKFSPPGATTYGEGESIVRVQESAPDPEFTLAHEIGHAFDYAAGDDPNKPGLKDELFDKNPERTMVGREFDDDTDPYIQQAYQLSERSRGGGKGTYRRETQELTADAISQAILNPRATKREAPELFNRIEQAAEKYGFEGAIPDPLADKSQRQGFLD